MLNLTAKIRRAGAIRWARRNVWRYGGDRDDLVLVGHSAGAHLAALCLVDAGWLAEEEVAPSESKAANEMERSPPLRVVSGFVGISGVYDVLRMGSNVVGAVLARSAFGDDRRGWKDASPLHRVQAVAAEAARRSGKTPPRSNATPRAAAESSATAGGTKSSPESLSASGHPCHETKSIASDNGSERGLQPVSADPLASEAICCPLIQVNALLITASSDFHLKEDAEALAEALDEARSYYMRRASGGDAAAPQGVSGDTSSRVHEKERCDATTGGEESGGGLGSVRSICLEGEDHLSTMISFGEPGKESSDAVLDFILGLPPPPRKRE